MWVLGDVDAPLDCTLKCTYNALMDYISTTELRTKASKLRDSLAHGKSTYLVHRSNIVGVVEPYNTEEKVVSEEQLKDLVATFSSGKKYSYKEREELYAKHLKEKYGKSISRH